MQWMGNISKNKIIEKTKSGILCENGIFSQISLHIDKSNKNVYFDLLKVFDHYVAGMWQFVSAFIRNVEIVCSDFSRIDIVVGREMPPTLINDGDTSILKIGVRLDEEPCIEACRAGDMRYFASILMAGVSKLEERYDSIKIAVKKALITFANEGYEYKRKMQTICAGGIDAAFYLICSPYSFSVKGIITDTDTKAEICEGDFVTTYPESETIPNTIKDIVYEDDKLYIRRYDNQKLFYIDCMEIRNGRFNVMFCESPYRDDNKTRGWYNTIGSLKTDKSGFSIFMKHL